MMKGFEEKKSDEKIPPEMETKQKIPHQKVSEKVHDEDCEKIPVLEKTIGMESVKVVKSQEKDLGEKELEKIEEKVRMLKEVFGGENEILMKFVRENKDLEMDLLCEKYLILDLN